MCRPTFNPRLSKLVRSEINARVKQADRFTPYEITCSLRAANPHVDLPHAAVREHVHEQMRSLVCSGLYQPCPVDVGGRVACLYVPTPILAASGPSFVVLN